MGRQAVTKKIGEHTYETYPLGATEGRKVFARIARAEQAGQGNFMLGDEADVESFYQTFGKVSFVKLENGNSPCVNDVFDDHFCCKYDEMLLWLAWCVEVNFKGFRNTAAADKP